LPEVQDWQYVGFYECTDKSLDLLVELHWLLEFLREIKTKWEGATTIEKNHLDVLVEMAQGSYSA
jgi:hypothetical protein